MTDIVEERCDSQLLLLMCGQLDRKSLAQNTGKVHGAENMLKPGVVSGGVHKLGSRELTDPAKTLHRITVDKFALGLVDPNITMNGVFDESPVLLGQSLVWLGF